MFCDIWTNLIWDAKNALRVMNHCDFRIVNFGFVFLVGVGFYIVFESLENLVPIDSFETAIIMVWALLQIRRSNTSVTITSGAPHRHDDELVRFLAIIEILTHSLFFVTRPPSNSKLALPRDSPNMSILILPSCLSISGMLKITVLITFWISPNL